MRDSAGYKEYVVGLLAGVATVGTGHPFDTVKVKMQMHNTVEHGITYRNGLHCTARILRTEGIKGLYSGATSSFMGMAFESSLLFWHVFPDETFTAGKYAKCCATTTNHYSICCFWWSNDRLYNVPLRAGQGCKSKAQTP